MQYKFYICTNDHIRFLFGNTFFNKKIRSLALNICLTALGVTATSLTSAGRPLITDDAAIIDSKFCQLETWYEHTQTNHGLWVNPSCNPFGKTEFALGGTRLHENEGSSFTTTEWQIKQLLRPYSDTQIGTAFSISGQRAHNNNNREFALNGITTLPLAQDEKHLFHLNLGALYAKDDQDKYTKATWGLAYDTEIVSNTRAAIETFGSSGERANWQVGLLYDLVPKYVQIDTSIGSAIGQWSDTRVFTIGAVFISPIFTR